MCTSQYFGKYFMQLVSFLSVMNLIILENCNFFGLKHNWYLLWSNAYCNEKFQCGDRS